jgi:hypothetical protein
VNQQEIFDKVATHLITQGKQSLRDDGEWEDKFCAYRGPDGTMCAAGCLIPDEEYNEDFETNPWFHVAPDIPSFANAPQEIHELITALQGVHDNELNWRSPELLKEILGAVATDHGLSSAVLN